MGRRKIERIEGGILMREKIIFLGVSLVLVVGIFSGCLSVTEKGSLEGEVWGESEPLVGAVVEGGGCTVFTGEGGKFLIEGLSSGEHYFFFSYPEHTGKVIKAEVKAGETRKISQEGRVYLVPEDEESLNNYIIELYSLGFYERALSQADLFLANYPGGNSLPQVLFIKGASFYYLGDFQNAISFLSYVRDNYPNNEFSDDAQYLLAKSFGEGLKDYGRAITEYEWLVNNYPGSEFLGVAYFEMGDCYYILGFYQEAYSNYDKAQSYGGEAGRKALYSAAHCLYKLENYPEAALLFSKYVELYPQTDISDDAQYFAGAAWYKAEEYSKALVAFQNCVNNYPQGTWYNGILIAPAALLNQGLCLEKLGRYQEAYNIYLRIIREYPGAKWADGSSLIKNVQFRIEWLKNNIL